MLSARRRALMRRRAPPLEPLPEPVEELSSRVLDAAYRVHTQLGPGLLEGVYQHALLTELKERGIPREGEVPDPISYRGRELPVGLRLDILVDDALVLELKSARKIAPAHEAQLLTYLKASGHRLGLLLNFGERRLKNGIQRIVL